MPVKDERSQQVMFRFLKPSETNHIFTDRITPPQFFVWLSIFEGPDEYLQLADLYIDPTDASLNVATRIDRKIMKFDLDGKQLRKVIGTGRPFLFYGCNHPVCRTPNLIQDFFS